jgi:RNA polymerase sigma-32 factor
MSYNLPALSQESDISRYIKEISKFPMLEEQEEKNLAIALHESGDLKAAEKLVTSHLRLVVKIAYSFKHYGLPMMDIVSEGNIGLMRAVKKFDVNKGFRLSTYAMWWIKAQIQEHVLRSWSLVKIGTTLAQKKLFFNLKKIKNKILASDQKYLSNSDVTEISNELNVTEKDVIDMDSRLSQGDIYLFDQKSSSEDNDETLYDTLASEDESQEEIFAKKEESSDRVTILHQAIKTLNEREQYILSQRKLGEEVSTLDELSKKYEISKERVRQIEKRAIEKIAAFFELKKAC